MCLRKPAEEDSQSVGPAVNLPLAGKRGIAGWPWRDKRQTGIYCSLLFQPTTVSLPPPTGTRELRSAERQPRRHKAECRSRSGSRENGLTTGTKIYRCYHMQHWILHVFLKFHIHSAGFYFEDFIIIKHRQNKMNLKPCPLNFKWVSSLVMKNWAQKNREAEAGLN